MPNIDAISITENVNSWLANSRQLKILHVFDPACNLVNERKEVLSIVTPQIGNGPFNLVVKDEILFSEHFNIESPISNLEYRITLGNLTINTADAELWNPHPDWEKLRTDRNHVTKLLLANYQLPILQVSNPLVSSFSTALVNIDISKAKSIASQLAGLGIGLTPSGDDFVMGALYAAWIIHSSDVASDLAHSVAESAAPLTTSLSAAWLRSAGRGEAGIRWHELFGALIAGDEISIKESLEKILAVGETSGADALAGFVGVLSAY